MNRTGTYFSKTLLERWRGERPSSEGHPAIYCRISRDAADDRLGVKRQERDARDLCRRNGWGVGSVYVDNDTSTYNGAARPEYPRYSPTSIAE